MKLIESILETVESLHQCGVMTDETYEDMLKDIDKIQNELEE